MSPHTPPPSAPHAGAPAAHAEVLERLRALQSADLPTHGGRTLAYVYDSGLAEVDRVGREAVAAFAATNALDPTAFPSTLQMENELVGRACDLIDAPGEAVGTVTSGGTESVLLAVQAARDARPDAAAGGPRPHLVVPATIHAAFHKAAHYFGLDTTVVPVGADHRPDPGAVLAAVEPGRTVLVALSAPSYAHGVIDPIEACAPALAERGVRVHVDACIGGWVLPFAARLGRPVAPWTFAVPGVTSISIDLHKYAYAPKGASVLLHRDAGLRRAQLFACAQWPGYTMLNSTLQSTRSGGPLAGAWAVTGAIGPEGYLELTRQLLEGVDRLAEGIEALPGLSLAAQPESSLLALRADDDCDVFTVADELAERGWLAQPQLSFEGGEPTLHLSLSPATAPLVPELLEALAAAVAVSRDRGPLRVPDDVAALIDALDPDTLGPAELDGLLAAVGMDADDPSAVPTRMGEVNLLLDRARPRLREALLLAFLDRLSRPARGAWGPVPG